MFFLFLLIFSNTEAKSPVNCDIGDLGQNLRKFIKNFNEFKFSSHTKILEDSVKSNFCKLMEPFLNRTNKNFRYPYLVMGTNANVGGGVHKQVGIDFVWDLFNMEFSVFDYSGIELGLTAGASSSSYLGLGLSTKNNVVDAWSGTFRSGTTCLGSEDTLLLSQLPVELGACINGFTGVTAGKVDQKTIGTLFGVNGNLGKSIPWAGAISSSQGQWKPNRKLNKIYEKTFRLWGAPVRNNGDYLSFDSGSLKNSSYLEKAIIMSSMILKIASTGGLSREIGRITTFVIAFGMYRDLMENGLLGKLNSCKTK